MGRIFQIHLRSLEGVDEEDLEWFEALLRLRSRRRKVLVAEVSGEVAGFVIAYKRKRTAYVDSIAVDPKWRGRGVGSALLAELEKVLKREGVELVALSVKGGNRAALDFYLRRGYAVKGVILLMEARIGELSGRAPPGFRVERVEAGKVAEVEGFKPATWWSTLTEPVDRALYRRYLKSEEALLAYKKGKLRGVMEFYADDEVEVEHIALSSYRAGDALKALLKGVKEVGEESGAEVVKVPVDASKKKMVSALLESGFKTVDTEYLAVKLL